MRIRSATVIVMLGLGVVAPAAASAGELLDQSWTPPFRESSSVGVASSTEYVMAQTFTVGLGGTLSRVELGLFGGDTWGPFEITLLTTTPDGVPDAPLATVTLTDGSALYNTTDYGGSSIPFTSIDLSSLNITVSPGERLAIELRSDSPYGWYGGYISPVNFFYPGGLMFSGVASPPGSTPTWSPLDGNRSWAFRTFVTPPGNTPTGTNVAVSPTPGMTVTFASVTVAGDTTVAPASSSSTTLSSSYKGLPTFFFDLQTTAGYTGTITVCVHYDDTGMSPGQEQQVTLLHLDAGVWVNTTTSLDTVANVVCGTVTHFSPFGIAIHSNRLHQ